MPRVLINSSYDKSCDDVVSDDEWYELSVYFSLVSVELLLLTDSVGLYVKVHSVTRGISTVPFIMIVFRERTRFWLID